MKRHIIAALTLLNATAGFAADLPLKAARPFAAAPIAYSWTGCYVGVQAGYAFNAQSDQSSFFELGPRTVNPQQSETASSWLAGGQVGCNYQFSNRAVIGTETEIWYQDLKATTPPIALTAPGEFRNMSFSNNLVTTSSVRVGYAFDRILAFGKVGAAFASFNHYGFNSFANLVPVDVYATGHNVSIGLLLGAGLEYAITDQLSIKGEYNYIDFGTVNHSYSVFQDVGTPIASLLRGTSNTHEREQLVKIGLNYRLFAL